METKVCEFVCRPHFQADYIPGRKNLKPKADLLFRMADDSSSEDLGSSDEPVQEPHGLWNPILMLDVAIFAAITVYLLVVREVDVFDEQRRIVRILESLRDYFRRSVMDRLIPFYHRILSFFP